MKHLASSEISNISDYISDILLELNDDGYHVYSWPSSNRILFRVSNGDSKKLESSDIEDVFMRIFEYLRTLNVELYITSLDYDTDNYASYSIDMDRIEFNHMFTRSYSVDYNGIVLAVHFKNNIENGYEN